MSRRFQMAPAQKKCKNLVQNKIESFLLHLMIYIAISFLWLCLALLSCLRLCSAMVITHLKSSSVRCMALRCGKCCSRSPEQARVLFPAP